MIFKLLFLGLVTTLVTQVHAEQNFTMKLTTTAEECPITDIYNCTQSPIVTQNAVLNLMVIPGSEYFAIQAVTDKINLFGVQKDVSIFVRRNDHDKLPYAIGLFIKDKFTLSDIG